MFCILSLSFIAHTMHMHLPRYTGKARIRSPGHLYLDASFTPLKAFNKRHLKLIKVDSASTSGDHNMAQLVGHEPARGNLIRFQIQCLNHSATAGITSSSYNKLNIPYLSLPKLS